MTQFKVGEVLNASQLYPYFNDVVGNFLTVSIEIISTRALTMNKWRLIDHGISPLKQ